MLHPWYMGFHARFMYIELHMYTMQNSEKSKGDTDAEQFHVPIMVHVN